MATLGVMSTQANRKLVLANRPAGEVTDDSFELVTEPVRDPGPGEVVLRTLWLGFEPAMRGWINDVPSYVPPVQIGEVMRSYGVAEVVASNDDRFAVGQLVHGAVGWQEYCVAQPDAIHLEVVPPEITQPELMLGVLGLPGLTAYFGVTDIGKPVPGDVVLVTAAAGATGSVAGQVARALGAARVIGTAGSDEKRAWVREVAGFDDCLDHYDEKIRRHMRAAAPDGYNMIFDNVGGAVLDAAIFNIALRARIVACGAISTGYRPERPAVGLHYYQLLTTRRSRMEGFLVTDYQEHFREARVQLQRWITEGKLRTEEDVLEGLERSPEALRRLFAGGNLGKQLVKVAE